MGAGELSQGREGVKGFRLQVLHIVHVGKLAIAVVEGSLALLVAGMMRM